MWHIVGTLPVSPDTSLHSSVVFFSSTSPPPSFPKYLEAVIKREYECLAIKLKICSFVAHTWNVLVKMILCLTDLILNPGFAMY